MNRAVCGITKPIIGMIHLEGLPGVPKYGGNVKSIIAKAIEEGKVYASSGIDILMIENMHDVPYLNRTVGPEITAVMSVVLYELKKQFNLPTGIQILAGANKDALAAAKASDADFIRAEGYVFSHIADEGTFNSDAGDILRYRKQIDAEKVKVFTDIKKKHSSHAVTNDVSIVETAKAAEYFLSDGVIITGSETGKEPSIEEISSVSSKVNIPVIAGSGITLENVEKYFPVCDAMIIGSYFKHDGFWSNAIDEKRVKEFVKKVDLLRK